MRMVRSRWKFRSKSRLVMKSTRTKRRQPKERYKISFPPFRVFPIHDYLGIDILRLMSLADDMGFVSDWMHGHKHVPSKEYAVKIDNMRVSFQHRLWIAFLFELFSILENMENLPEFSEFHNRLCQEGQEALSILRSAGKESENYSLLERIRNRTFHYDREKFQGALKALKKRFGEEITDGFIAEIIRKNPLHARTYYSLASTVRNAVIFGLKPPEELQKEMDQLLELHGQFYRFLDSALKAYLEIRNLKPFLKWE